MLSILDEKCDVSIRDLRNQFQSPLLYQLLPRCKCLILVQTNFTTKATGASVLSLRSLRLGTLGL